MELFEKNGWQLYSVNYFYKKFSLIDVQSGFAYPGRFLHLMHAITQKHTSTCMPKTSEMCHLTHALHIIYRYTLHLQCTTSLVFKKFSYLYIAKKLEKKLLSLASLFILSKTNGWKFLYNLILDLFLWTFIYTYKGRPG